MFDCCRVAGPAVGPCSGRHFPFFWSAQWSPCPAGVRPPRACAHSTHPNPIYRRSADAPFLIFSFAMPIIMLFLRPGKHRCVYLANRPKYWDFVLRAFFVKEIFSETKKKNLYSNTTRSSLYILKTLQNNVLNKYITLLFFYLSPIGGLPTVNELVYPCKILKYVFKLHRAFCF